MPKLLTETEMKRLEKKMEKDPLLKKAVNGKYKRYKAIIEKAELYLPELIRHCRIKFEIEI